MAPSTKTITTFRHLHPLAEVDLPPFVDDFYLETNLVSDREAFISTFTRAPIFSSNDLLSMVYELL
jgi:hypothetical protein